MFVLDTDIATLVLHYADKYPRLTRRLLATPPDEIFLSVVSTGEMIQGALAVIRRDQRAGDWLFLDFKLSSRPIDWRAQSGYDYLMRNARLPAAAFAEGLVFTPWGIQFKRSTETEED